MDQSIISTLTQQCQNEQCQHDKTSASCYQLFLLALKQNNQEAWDAIYTTFENRVRGWVHTHPSFQYTDEKDQFFINGAWIRFAQSAPAKEIKSCGQYLNYIKLCVHSAILDYLKKAKRTALNDAVDTQQLEQLRSNQPHFDKKLFTDYIMSIVWKLTEDDLRKRLVAEDLWIYGYTPRQIQSRHPDKFETAAQVSAIRLNLLKQLKRYFKDK